MRPGESCATCVFMVERFSRDLHHSWAECHRYAPTPLADRTGTARWPLVNIKIGGGLEPDWCGMYRRARPETPCAF